MGLTKEQKIARKIAKRLEKKQAAAEKKKRRKLEELEREVAAHLLWKKKLDESWRDAMLKIKAPAYRQKIEIMWHTLDRAYDKKDGLIKHLMYLRDIANYQYSRTVGNFCVSTDVIICGFLKDLENMCKKNDIKTADLLKFGRDELSHYLEAHKKAETHLQLLLYSSHHAADSLAWNIHGDNMVRRDDESSTYHEIRDTLHNILEGTNYSMWEQYKATLRGYVSKTAENQKQLRLLRKKEQMMTDIIAAQAKKLIINEKIIRNLRLELVAYETGEKQAGFRDRRNRYRDACLRMKILLNDGMKIDMKQISLLVKAADDPVEWLTAAKKKSEKILRMAAQCRKYETQREKVMPYGSETPKKPLRTHVRMHPNEDPMIFSTIASTCGLARLWHRISNAELSKRALLREKLLLERENASLECKLSEQNKENVAPKATRCTCTDPVPLKTYSIRPCAIEGSLEMKKFVR